MANKKNTKKKKNGAKNNSSNMKNNSVKNVLDAEEEIVEEEFTEEEDVLDEEEITEGEVEIVDSKKKEKKETVSRAKKDLVYADSGSDEIGKLFKIVLIVTAIMIVFYGVTVVVTKNANASKKKNEKNEETVIQYKKIIVGTMLEKDGDYYVLLEKEDDENLSKYETAIQMIGIGDESNKIYEIDLSSSFNSKYLSNESNYSSDLDEFKVSGTTLIKVSDHNIVESYDNSDDIGAKLEELQ